LVWRYNLQKNIDYTHHIPRHMKVPIATLHIARLFSSSWTVRDQESDSQKLSATVMFIILIVFNALIHLLYSGHPMIFFNESLPNTWR
jgi:hypothetical protein